MAILSLKKCPASSLGLHILKGFHARKTITNTFLQLVEQSLPKNAFRLLDTLSAFS